MMILKTLSSGWHVVRDDAPPLFVNDACVVHVVLFNVSCDIHLTLGNYSKVYVHIFCTTDSP